jgi:succinoglycan biosynthesis transport protein ExoP
MSSQVSLKDIQGIIRRRKKLCLLVFTIIFSIAWIIAFIIPPIYQSQAMILIEEQQIPEDFVKSTVTGYAEQRLQMITRQIMSRKNLKEIIEANGLYPELVHTGHISDAVSTMKNSILFEPISSTTSGNSNSNSANAATVAFSIAYEGKVPEVVQKVTADLANLYIEEDIKTKGRQVKATTKFLEEELERLRKQVKEHESELSKFKAQHLGELPENAVANIQTISRLEQEVTSFEGRIRSLQDRKLFLQSQIATVDPLNPITTEEGKVASNPTERLKELRLDLMTMESRLSERHPDVKKLKREIAELEAQVGSSDDSVMKLKLLSEKKTRLASLKGTLGAQHPDVIKLSKEVDTLSREVENMTNQSSLSELENVKADNPVYINLKTQIVSVDAEMKNLMSDKDKAQTELDKYRQKAESSPVIEKEYNDLTLDFDNAKKKYGEMLDKLMSAKVSSQMQQEDRGERFTITDPPGLPTRPIKPNRFAIVLLGFVLAAGISVSLVALQEGMDPSLKSEDDLSRITGVPVLTSLTYMETAPEIRAQRIKKLVWLVGTAGTILGVIIFINTFIMPLNELWENIVK